MRNFVQPGEILSLVAPSGGVVAGKGYLIGAFFAVASVSVAAGLNFDGAVEGVFELDAEGAGSGQDIVQGGPVYWDATNARATKTATGNTLIGAATVAKATLDTTVKVNLWQRAAAAGVAITKPVTTGATNTTPYGYVTAAQADAIVTAVRALIDYAGLSGLTIPG